MRGSDRVNHLNMGLMFVSCLTALLIPFELFLFAYAVLGPAHYLTEISWLEKRGFFTRRPGDFWVLALLLLPVLAVIGSPPSAVLARTGTFSLLALCAAFVLVKTERSGPRLAAFVLSAASLAGILNSFGAAVTWTAIFLPTLIHVYIFTGFFILYGALKENSRSGFLSFGVFLLCPLVCYWVDARTHTPAAYVVVSYWKGFSALNLAMLGIDTPVTRSDGVAAGAAVFESEAGLRLMRFVAFAYTYHYLNWFSKTSIIGWHEVSRRRIVLITVFWLTSVGIYVYDFTTGVAVLTALSLLHVFLEFPLNHISIQGTFRLAHAKLAPG